MVDVVPALNKAIQRDFQNNVMKDRRLARISKRIRDGTATQKDGHDYAELLGEDLSRSLLNNLNADTLPDGKLYYNIARRTVTPALEENYNLTNEIAADIQSALDANIGIGLGVAKAKFPSERIQGLIDKMCADNILLEQALVWLGEPIINNSEAFFDDFVKENARVRYDMGLSATLTRSAEAGCCKWCEALAGVYEYGKAPEDIYRRHEFCRCTVTYSVDKKSQNVWTKRTWATTSEELERRKDTGAAPRMTKAEQESRIGQIERDVALRNFTQETGYTRQTAARAIRNKTPDEIQTEIKKIQARQEKIRG